MKKIFIIVLCFVLLNKATAQADKIILDNVFQNIDKTTIPTGYLQDYGVAFVNKEAYNGILTDSNAIANLSAFRLMYNDLLSARINLSALSLSLFVIARNEAISQNNRKIASGRNLRNDAKQPVISSRKNTTV